MLLTPKTCKLLYGYVKILCNNWSYLNRLKTELGLELKNLSKVDDQSQKTNQHEIANTHSKIPILPLQANLSISQARRPLENEVSFSSSRSQAEGLSKASVELSMSQPAATLISSSALKTGISIESSLHEHHNNHVKINFGSLSKPFDYTSESDFNEIPSFMLDFDYESLKKINPEPPLSYLSKILYLEPREKSIFRTKVIYSRSRSKFVTSEFLYSSGFFQNSYRKIILRSNWIFCFGLA